jgi:hypothetical protein
LTQDIQSNLQPIAKGARTMMGNQTKQTKDPVLSESGSLPPALPPATGHPACDPNCVDVTGITPEGIRIDPDITEGHPGYEESGDSEIIPPERLSGESSAGAEEKPG